MFASFILVLALIVPTNAVFAQATPQAPTDNNRAAPSTDLAVPDEVAEVVKLRESLTAEQISKMQAILDSYKADFQQISSDLASLNGTLTPQDKKLFLPLVNANGSANDKAQSQTKAPDVSASVEKVAKMRQIALNLTVVQNKIDQQIATVLTAAQNAVYAKSAAKLKSTGRAVSARLQALTASSQSPDGTESNANCSTGAYYGAIANWYAYYGLVYGFFNYAVWGTTYSYYAYVNAHYGYSYVSTGLLYAGAAYFDSYYGFGYDSNGWSDTATPAFYNANYYGYYAYYYESYCS